MKVIWLTETQSAVQYQNPDTGNYSSSSSKYNNMHFLTGNFGYAASDGYYVIDPVLWNISGTSAHAYSLRIVTENGTKKYYYGNIDLKNIDQNAGISGTIDEIKLSAQFE